MNTTPSVIKNVPLDEVDPNPYRDLSTYPWDEAKVEQLMRSIEDVGFWEGVIARPINDRFESAFGHHRIEAARRLKLKTVPLVVRVLSDRDMIRFMGRENGEDYRSDFLVMLNTWEGAVRFFPPQGGKLVKSLEIAKLLGWTRLHLSNKGVPDGIQMTHLAAACSAACALLNDNQLTRETLRGLSVTQARELVVVTHKDIGDVDRAAAKNPRFPPMAVAKAKQVIARSAEATASDVRAGRVLSKDVRTEVRVNVMRDARRHMPKTFPLFTKYGAAVTQKIRNMLATDRVAQNINEIEKALPGVTLEEDHAMLRDLHHALRQLERRADLAVRRTTPNKVVPLKAITEET